MLAIHALPQLGQAVGHFPFLAMKLETPNFINIIWNPADEFLI